MFRGSTVVNFTKANLLESHNNLEEYFNFIVFAKPENIENFFILIDYII